MDSLAPAWVRRGLPRPNPGQRRPERRRSQGDWLYVTLVARVGRRGPDRAVWAWLLEALKDVGYPWFGSSGLYEPWQFDLTLTLRGDFEAFKAAVLELWMNECPGGSIEVHQRL